MGGIAFSPLIPCCTTPSTPPALSRRSCQAAVSPNLGALSNPMAWQEAQILSYSPLGLKLGSRGADEPPAAATAGASAAGAALSPAVALASAAGASVAAVALASAAGASVAAVALASAVGVSVAAVALASAAGASGAGGGGSVTVSWPTGARRSACNFLLMVISSLLPPQKKKGRTRNTGMNSASIIMMSLVFCGMSVCAMMMLHLRKFIRDLPRELSQTRQGGASICAAYRVHFAAFATWGF